jgi:preprotein translocase subunit SecA
MRIFASEKMAVMMQRLGMEKGEAIEHKMVNRAIENAQQKVEEMNHLDDQNDHATDYPHDEIHYAQYQQYAIRPL